MHFGENELFPSLIGLSPYPRLIPRLFNVNGFGPPLRFTETPAWPWVGHKVSRLPPLTKRLFKTCFRFGYGPEALILASEE